MLHTKLGVGEAGDKEQAITTYLKILELRILAPPVSLKELILDLTESKQAISDLEIYKKPPF